MNVRFEFANMILSEFTQACTNVVVDLGFFCLVRSEQWRGEELSEGAQASKSVAVVGYSGSCTLLPNESTTLNLDMVSR